MKKLIQEKVLLLIESDRDYCEKIDNSILKRYENFNELQKFAIDEMFMSITGYSLNSIIQEEDDYLRDLLGLDSE